MKSKILPTFALCVVAFIIIAIVLRFRFQALPPEKVLSEKVVWAPSPYEWMVFAKVDQKQLPNFNRLDLPSLYSPLKMRAQFGRETFYPFLDQIRWWMVTDNSRNIPELWKVLTTRDAAGEQPEFAKVLETGFGGATEDCSFLKVERAFRIRNLGARYFNPARAYLEKCQVAPAVILLANLEHEIQIAPGGPRFKEAVAQLRALKIPTSEAVILTQFWKDTLVALEGVEMNSPATPASP